MFWLALCGDEKVIYSMISQPAAFKQNPFIFQLDKKAPMFFTWVSLIFIYVLQYPLSQLLPNATPIPQYDWSSWLVAYGFVLLSVAIFMPSLYVGLSGKQIKIVPTIRSSWKTTKCLGLPIVFIVFAMFGLWSYLMVDLKIGMTIHADFDPLPFRLTGILFYGRFFIQPLVLAYIAVGYTNSKLKWLIYLLLIALGAWVSLSSGSRFVGILFAMPMLLLFNGKRSYLAFGFPLLVFIVIASLSRNFYLPMIIGDHELIRIYSNEAQQASVTENIYLLPILYLINRTMGIAEVLLTLGFGNLSTSFFVSLQTFASYFLPFIPPGLAPSVKNIYGFSDDVFGGFGLDMFSTYLVKFGGDYSLYTVGLALTGWLLGKTYRMFAIGLIRFGLHGFGFLIFILFFILVFEGRAYLFLNLFMLAWLFSRKSTPGRTFALLGIFLPSRRSLLPTKLNANF